MKVKQDLKFTVRVHDDEDGHGLWADIDELPGCFAAGDNLEELRESVRDSIAAYLSVQIVSEAWGERSEADADTQQLLVKV